METLQWTTQDKTTWPAGPWHDEPDKIQWQDPATGLACLIHRGGGGALCGYVGVPSSHPWHGHSYDQRVSCTNDCDPDYCYDHEIDGRISVHGGLTYSGACSPGATEAEGICHLPSRGEPDDVHWFGFDCSHFQDLRPESLAWTLKTGSSFSHKGEIYRNVEYVTAEVTRLAAQLAEVK